jgi:D-alanyl-D-alanine carboxypeptidase
LAEVSNSYRAALAALLGLTLIAAGCSSDQDEGAPVTAALTNSVVELRQSLGQQWGEPIPGIAAAAVVGEGNAVSAVVSGSADPPGSEPLEVRDRFHIGSITKTFTAALVMQLDQEGLLSIDDPISTWIDYPDGSQITIAMLLGHTSGVADFTDNSEYTSTESPERSIELAKELAPVFPPGSGWSYSNTNYTMLGVIAERATRSTWQEEIESRFLEPLELTDTYLWTGDPRPPTVDGSRLACSGPGEPKCDPPESGLELLSVADGFDWTVAWSAGSLVSTPADVTRWMRALVSGDVLDREHRALMTTATPQSEASRASAPAFGNLRWTGNGLGLFRYEIEGQGVGWGHEGLINGFTANTVHMVDREITVALTSNFQMTDSFTALGSLVGAVASADGTSTVVSR